MVKLESLDGQESLARMLHLLLSGFRQPLGIRELYLDHYRDGIMPYSELVVKTRSGVEMVVSCTARLKL